MTRAGTSDPKGPRSMSRTRILGGLGLLVLTVTGLAPARAEESWSSVFIAGAKVGSIHSKVEPFKDRGRDRIRVQVDLALSFKRLDATVTIRMRQATIETRDGSVESLDVRTLASGQELHVFGAAEERPDDPDDRGDQPAPADDPRLGAGGPRPVCRRAEPGARADQTRRETRAEDVHTRPEQGLRHHPDGQRVRGRAADRPGEEVALAGRADDHAGRQTPARVRHDALGRSQGRGPEDRRATTSAAW